MKTIRIDGKIYIQNPNGTLTFLRKEQQEATKK